MPQHSPCDEKRRQATRVNAQLVQLHRQWCNSQAAAQSLRSQAVHYDDLTWRVQWHLQQMERTRARLHRLAGELLIAAHREALPLTYPVRFSAAMRRRAVKTIAQRQTDAQ